MLAAVLLVGVTVSAPLTDRGLENVVAFTRLLGYTRHFDPADAASATDWNEFAIDAIGPAEQARDADELASVLRAEFGPLDPALRVDVRPPAIPKLERGPEISKWNNFGWNGGGKSFYRNERRRWPAAIGIQPPQAIEKPLGGGVYAAVPTVLWADAQGTLPHGGPARWSGKAGARDRSTRLASIAIGWNVIQHFYPYFDEVDAGWDEALREGLRAAATDGTSEQFHATLERMFARLNDGHVMVNGPGDEYPFIAPLSWAWVENQLVITAADSSTGLHTGDVVRTIEGVDVAQRYRELEPRLAGATEGRRRVISLGRMAGGEREQMDLEVEGADGVRRKVTVASTRRYLPFGVTRPPAFTELEPGVWYVDVQRIDDAIFEAKVDTLARARGIIFDVRGYPGNLGHEPLAHLTNKTMKSARWGIPHVRQPDHVAMQFEYTDWTISPLSPRFKAKVAFLTDARAISYAETWMGIVERYKLGAIVGEPTAGTNGNIATLTLPDRSSISFTGMKVLKHDGSRHQGIGIRPTVSVSPTIAGVRAGRDEQLDAALALVSR